jgi:hypothetical protein
LCCSSHEESLKAKPKPLLSGSIKLLFFLSFSFFWGVSKKQFKAKPQTCCDLFPQANFA